MSVLVFFLVSIVDFGFLEGSHVGRVLAFSSNFLFFGGTMLAVSNWFWVLDPLGLPMVEKVNLK